jgi:hypothetical protein
MSYSSALLVDLLIVFMSVIVLVRFARLTHTHPATIYVIFHLYTFTWRLYALAGGAPTLFTDWGPSYSPLREDEIVRAALWADVALPCCVVVWLIAANRSARAERVPAPEHGPTGTPLNRRVIWFVVILAAPFGVLGQLLYTSLPTTISPGVTVEGPWGDSSYLQILQSWPGLLLIILIYYYGFRWWLVLPIAAYLGIMSVQGYHRFRVLMPVILLVQIYLDRRGKKWPGWGGVAILAMLAASFFPMKLAGKMIQDRASITDISSASMEIIDEASSGRAADQQFLDEFACSMALIDLNGKHYYGAPYLALLTLPVPRQWWPDKPSFTDYILEFSRPERPMYETGMIFTYLGEAYANLSYLGLLVLPAAIAFAFVQGYYAAYRAPYYSVPRFLYLMLSCNLLQIYRDGLVSIVFFLAVNMMPLMIIVLLHRVFASFKKRPTNAMPQSPTDLDLVGHR